MNNKLSAFLLLTAALVLAAPASHRAAGDPAVPFMAPKPPAGWTAKLPVIWNKISGPLIRSNNMLANPPYTPSQLQQAYGLSALNVSNLGQGATVSIVDAYGDDATAGVSNMQTDLAAFSSYYNLPYNGPSSSSPTLTEVQVDGPPTSTDQDAVIETCLDVEWVHAIAPYAHIVLVIVPALDGELYDGIYKAQQLAPIVSMSFGGGEWNTESSDDSYYFNQANTTYFASTGDSGGTAAPGDKPGVSYPSTSPGVTAVGGTALTIQENGDWVSETGWSGSGGGVSAYEPNQAFQLPWISSGNRQVPDISALADPGTGVNIYSSSITGTPPGFIGLIGGTSLAAPLWAGILADINAKRATPVGEAALQTALYSYYGSPTTLGTYLHDITIGNNGPFNCLSGFDNVTGIGAPICSTLVPALIYDLSGPPAVTGISPAAGPASGGTRVSITGTNFTGATEVSFGGSAAGTAVTVNSATSVTVTSPSASPSTVDVQVTTPGGTSPTSSADHYTFLPVPTVSSVSPTFGSPVGGTLVTVSGSGFANGASVSFGGNPATDVTVLSASSLTCTSPAGTTGVVDVQVTTQGGTSATSSADEFTYVAAATITGVSPNVGPIAGGTNVTITGTGFVAGATVSFGAVAATNVDVVSATSITCTSPAQTAGIVDITVTVPAGFSPTTQADKFTYLGVPSVTKLTPAAGPVAGRTTVTVTGTGFFAGATTVAFGGNPASSVAVQSSTALKCVSPAGAAGTVNMVVTTPGGTSAPSSSNQFTYMVAPTLTSISPTSGPAGGGTAVTVTGTNFAAGATVTFGTAPATNVNVVNTTTLTCASPAGSAGAVHVVVTTPGGSSATSSADLFTYIAPPAVTKISPSDGSVTGNTSVVITGTGFTSTSKVTFGGIAAKSAAFNSTTSITAVSPAHSSGGVNIVVSNANGASATSAANLFTYLPVPTVSSVNPSSGPLTGGGTVTVTGTSFAAGATVAFGTVAATSVSVQSATVLTCKAPAGSAGVVNVVVTTPGGTSPHSLADWYTYVPVPVVTLVNPATGPTTGHTTVTIAGTNLANATQVTFGTASVSTFVSDTSTSIKVVAPASAAGSVNVTVKTAGGTSATSTATKYTYIAPPAITSVSPSAGPIAGKTTVTIRGSGFYPGASVTFGGTAATGVVVENAYTMTPVSPAHAAAVLDIVATTAYGASQTSAADKFTYLPVPTVTGISPSAGYPAGGSYVYVGGTGFIAGATVTFGGRAATNVTVLSSTEMSCNSPSGNPGTVDVVVTTPGGTSKTTTADQFSYLAVPSVLSVSPSYGPTKGGTAVTVKGTGFLASTTVTFGVASASNVVVVNANTLTCISPAEPAGAVNVTVSTEGGTSASVSADKFTYYAVPAATSISPSSGPTTGGTVVTLTGSGFVTGATVKFGTVAATSVSVASPTSITCKSPAEAAGTVYVTVTTLGGTSAAIAADKFTY